MQDLMRRHKRAILVFIILFMAVPFIFFFGMPSRRYQNQNRNTFQDDVVAKVGGVPILASEYRRFLEATAQRQTRPGSERPTFRELDENGTAARVLQQMVDSSLLTLQEQHRKFNVDKSLLQEQMKQWEQFRDETGKFDAAAWNAWVKAQRGLDWNEIYSDLRKSISRQVFLSMVAAPAGHVLDREIEKQLEQNYTKLRIKYARIDPKVEPTEEQIQAEYTENQDKYKTPDQRVVEFVAIPLQPEVPAKVWDLIKQAREGADFAALADENSDLKSSQGGDMGWQTSRERELEHRKPLFNLAVGQVSDPVYAFNSYFIYKVEEERTNEETGQREVRARQIMIKAEIPEEERAKRVELAQNISAKAKESHDLKAAAEEAGLEVKRTNTFTKESNEIENVPLMDIGQFRTAFDGQTEENVYDVIAGRDNLYVAAVVEMTPGVVSPLDEIRERVLENTISKLKGQDDYKNRVKDYAEKIKSQATSVTQIPELFPELEVEIKESSEFTRKEYFLQKDKLYLQPALIFDTLGDGPPGTMGGPVTDFLGYTYFIELLERTLPTEEDKTNWAEERKQLRDRALQTAENQMLEDYLADLRERSMADVQITYNQSVIDRILGRGEKEESAPEGEVAHLPPQAPVTSGLEDLAEE